MKVALVHEFLTQLGGAERVLAAFHEIYPGAPVYTLVYDEQKTQGVFAEYDIRPSFLQKLPGMPKNYKWYLPFMARATEAFDLSGYDLVLSDSSAFAKGVRTPKLAFHICYCHTPTRYLWESMDEYVASIPYSSVTKYLAKWYLQMVLRSWDKKAAARPNIFIANSQTVAARIKQYYERDALVVYPPVDAQFFRPLGVKQNYYLTASRLEPYKKIDLVVQTFTKLGLPLKVAGVGTNLPELKKQAGSNIEFLGRVSDEKLRELYSGARAFVFPALEDAGIMVLESLACGTPVIGLNAGGTAEFITEGVNGVLFGEQTVEALSRALERFQKMKLNPLFLREFALQHDKKNFQSRIKVIVEDHAYRH